MTSQKSQLKVGGGSRVPDVNYFAVEVTFPFPRHDFFRGAAFALL